MGANLPACRDRARRDRGRGAVAGGLREELTRRQLSRLEPLKARTCFCSLLSPPHELHAQQLINEGDRASSMLSQRPANRDYDRSSATPIPIPAPPCSGPLRSRPRSSGRLLPNNSGPRWFRLEEWMAWITFIGMEHFPSQIGALESEARAWAKLTGVNPSSSVCRSKTRLRLVGHQTLIQWSLLTVRRRRQGHRGPLSSVRCPWKAALHFPISQRRKQLAACNRV